MIRVNGPDPFNYIRIFLLSYASKLHGLEVSTSQVWAVL